MNKVILILLDGMRYDTAVDSMGYLMHLVESHQASLFKIVGELPTMSRPMYETIHTGLPSSQHKIVSNAVIRGSIVPNIFQLATIAGRKTAAAAYYWFSELYNRFPYHLIDDREVDDEHLLIQHGRFYYQVEFPDIDLCLAAASLVHKFHPDYLLVHLMGMDYMGETFGPDSSQYRNQATIQDAVIAPCLEEWKEQGYSIILTSDHGINGDNSHGGSTPDCREVPLIYIPNNGSISNEKTEKVSHLQIAPTICKLLEIPIPQTMRYSPFVSS